MASCQTAQWGNSSPYVKLTVTETASTGSSATLTWTLQYIAPYAASSSYAKDYSVTVAGTKVKTGTFSIGGKTGTHTIASDTKVITKTTAAQSISFSLSFGFNLTWSDIYKGTLTASGSISVAAKTSYKIQYNANGGSGAPSNQTKWYGTNLTLSSTKPARTGYTFQGWATSASGSVAYKAGASYTANAAATLYAVWKANTYTVSYNANGGSGQPSNQTKTYGKTLTLSSTKPTRTGYTFVSWNTKADGSGTSYAAGVSYTANAAVTLYAIWKINTYTVTYNANGGTLGSVKTQTKNYGTALKLTGTATRANYTFKGWATSAGGSVAYASGADYTANADVTLYAIWKLSYVKPRINGLVISRCDSAGEISDEGTYAIVGFIWESDYAVSSILIEWKLASSTEYASTDKEKVEASGTTGTVYRKVGDGAIDPEKTYTFRVTVTDSNGSNYTIRNITGSIYHIDFKPPKTEDEVGGVSIGKPAELDGVFDVGFKARFRDSVAFDSPAAARASLKAWCFDDTVTDEATGSKYVGMARPDGTATGWTRVTQSGLLPYASGGQSSSIGTSVWPFKNGYFKNLYADGNDILNGSGWKTATLTSDFVKYDGKDDNIPQYIKIGKLVQVRGAVSPKAAITGSATAYTIFTLPEEYRPSKQVSVLCPGSGSNQWLLTITAAGAVRFARYNNGAGYVDAATNAWLSFHTMYFVD